MMVYSVTLLFKNGHTVTEQLQESSSDIAKFTQSNFPVLQGIMAHKDESTVLTLGYTIFRVSDLAAMSFNFPAESPETEHKRQLEQVFYKNLVEGMYNR